MIDSREWITRLQDQVPDLLEVAGSLELATRFASGEMVSPSAYVIPLSEAPTGNELSMGVTQLVTVQMAVIAIVYNHAGADLAGDEHLRHIRIQILRALLNWTPGDGTPVERSAGQRISGVDANLLIWQDILTTDYMERSV